jgi:coproporphyrinogen III oxidase
MSLPEIAGWEYNFKPEANSPEAYTLSQLKKGIAWV